MPVAIQQKIAALAQDDPEPLIRQAAVAVDGS
jgi:hypothetical protein